jgi:hypothetical protein
MKPRLPGRTEAEPGPLLVAETAGFGYISPEVRLLMMSYRVSLTRRWFALAVLVGATCALGARETQESPFRIAEDVVSNGGGRGSSSQFAVQDIIAQPFQLGTFSTSEFSESIGFVETLTASLSDPLDINSDGTVNAGDTFIFSSGWHRIRGEPGYRDRADINGDTIIDRKDLYRYLEMLKEMP